MRKLIALGRSDLRQMTRDPMLLFMLVAPLLLVASFGFAVPPAMDWLHSETGWDLDAFYPMIVGFVLLLIPLLPGTMAGFLMLDERDEGLLYVYAVTPIAKRGYFFYRLAVPMGIMICYGVAVLTVVRVVSLDGFAVTGFAAAVLMTTLHGIITALFLAGFAPNKVEGLALSKLAAFPVLAPLLLLLPEPWQAAAWPLPAYWTAKTVMLALNGDHWVLLCGLFGLSVHIGWLLVFYRHFLRKPD